MGSLNGGNSSLFALDVISKALQLISVGFNGAIIYTIWRKSLMKITSSRLVFSLCLSHLLVSFISIVISIITFILPTEFGIISTNEIIDELDPNGEIDENKLFCLENTEAILSHILLYITFAVAISTLMSVTLISVERYITIARPMKYKSIVTPTRCFVAISLCWVLSALLVIFPIVFFNHKTKQCGSFLIPTGSLGWYFATVFTVLTILALSVMIICYAHIFSIAKEKCQKVQIGQFSASAPASISSEWASSVNSSIQGQQNISNRGWFYSGSRMTSSNSLLHWVLMANLRHNSNPLRPSNGVPQSPDLSPTSSLKSASDPALRTIGFSKDPKISRAKRKWRKYLQQNYNSPRKTVCTILFLIGSVIITQLPMSFVLFTHLERNPVLFYFCHDLLFALSSVTNPILYGFLNRNIRDCMMKIFRPQSLRRHRQKRANSNHSVLGELKDIFTPKTERIIIQSRKGSLTSEDSNSSGVCTVTSGKLSYSNSTSPPVPPNPNPLPARRKDTVAGLEEFNRFQFRKSIISKKRLEIGQQELVLTSNLLQQETSQTSNIIELNSDSTVQREGIEDGGIVSEDEIFQNLGFPRKPSQDSGADMTFSDEDTEDHNHEQETNQASYHNKEDISRSLRSVRNVENYLRIYGDVLEIKNSVKSKSDSDINSGLQNFSHYQPQKMVMKSQCQLEQEMILVRHLQLADDLMLGATTASSKPSQLASASLSSSRQNLLLRVRTHSSCYNNCSADDLLQECSCVYDYGIEGGNCSANEKFMCADFAKIGNVFSSSSNSDDSSSENESEDDEERVKVQIVI